LPSEKFTKASHNLLVSVQGFVDSPTLFASLYDSTQLVYGKEASPMHRQCSRHLFDFGELDGGSLEEPPCLLEYLGVLAYATFARPFDLHFVVKSFPYSAAAKAVKKTMSHWPGKRFDHEMQIEWASKRCICKDSEVLQQARGFLKAASIEFAEIEKVSRALAVHRRGFLSIDELSGVVQRCEERWRIHKTLNGHQKVVRGFCKLFGGQLTG
jgi:hypothetical protein